ncbi:MAG: gamma-glutamyl-gamma-aminobutyrate hydrolase family protein [Acidobacteriota bacterium]
MQPLIAISPCRALPDYQESVRRSEGEARVLDPASDHASDVVKWARGLLLTGGVDVDPARYGEPKHASVTDIDAARDAYEIDLVREALAANLPILAICRGMQVMNVACGGTLVQDIPTQVFGAIEHTVKMPLYSLAHEVWVVRGTALWTLTQTRLKDGEALDVNSRHHQSVKRLAEGFDLSANSPDGVIEGMERHGAAFCVGVQWHPENFWRTGEFRPLFDGFIAAAQ